MNAAGRSVTKIVRIACDPQAAFDFLADLGNWPLWAVVNVKSTSRTDDPDWWDMVTPHGTARLRMRACARHGILDHDFVDPQASWTVPARVVRNSDGTEFMITFFQPPGFTDAFFDEQVSLVDIEMMKLKELLEAMSSKRHDHGQATPGCPPISNAQCPGWPDRLQGQGGAM